MTIKEFVFSHRNVCHLLLFWDNNHLETRPLGGKGQRVISGDRNKANQLFCWEKELKIILIKFHI